ncbi:hypothetical protein AeMF1_020085 [Aphanomyces euteiches]|nr:hypothetical protein AeMF1_020085 [Aphanomyces euteiches]
MRPPSPVLGYSETHVESNAYATPPSSKHYDDSKDLPSRASTPESIPPAVPIYVTDVSFKTPEKKKRDPELFDSPVSATSSNGVSRPYSGTSRLPVAPGKRVAALTRENVSRLSQYPFRMSLDRDNGSVCSSQSVRSRISVKTDGGTVFSRLYNPNYLQEKDLRMSMHKDRQLSQCSFMPKTNSKSRTPSVASRDSFCSESSNTSVHTDITAGLSASSRLYDPDYIRKRHARLEKLREERELRECTFAPAVNKSANERLLSREPKPVQVTPVSIPAKSTSPAARRAK